MLSLIEAHELPMEGCTLGICLMLALLNYSTARMIPVLRKAWDFEDLPLNAAGILRNPSAPDR